MRHLLLIAMGILSVLGVQAQVLDKPVAGSGDALGQTYIALSDNWAGIRNNAALGWDSTYFVGVHHQNRFVLEELGLSSLAARIPASPGAFGVSFSHTGYSQFNITRADVSYGMKLSSRFVVGVGLAFHHAHYSDDYSNSNALTVSAGLQFRPTSKVLIGAYLFNPARASLDKEQTMPACLGLGVTYSPVSEVLLTIQVDDDTENKTSIRAGIEYQPIDMFKARIGYSSGNVEGLTAGVGLLIKGFVVDISVNYHQVLGATPLLSVAYQFN